MIDWVKADLPLSEPLDLPHGRVIRLSADGDIEWETRTWHDVPNGSGDTSVRLRAWSDVLEVSGNPNKWFAGHNLWGSDDLVGLTVELALAALATFGVRPPEPDEARWRAGGFAVRLAHVTLMFDLGSDDAVVEYLGWLEGAPASNRRVHGLRKGSTVAWTTRSLRAKAYHKLQELLDTRALANHPDRDRLLAWAAGKLRWEVELRSRELKRLGLDAGSMWLGLGDTRNIALTYAKLIQMPTHAKPKVAGLDVPQHLRATLFLWSQGADLRISLSRPTYYRHRKALLEYGYDISRPPAPEERTPPIERLRCPFPPLWELPIAEPPEQPAKQLD